MKFSFLGITVTTGKDAEPEQAPSRIWVRDDEFFFDPEDGAIPYDCAACRDSTGGICETHHDERYRENVE